jgi:hypothetical protein
MPMKIRYAAPAYLTTLNATAEEASSADTPIVAASTWTRPPVWIPSAETMPARRPSASERDTM